MEAGAAARVAPFSPPLARGVRMSWATGNPHSWAAHFAFVHEEDNVKERRCQWRVPDRCLHGTKGRLGGVCDSYRRR